LETIFKKKLVLKGLGFRMNVVENFEKIEFKLGFSHLIYITIPKTIKVKIKKNKINVEGTNKVLVGTFINKILSLKIPDCYKGKGF
jgi:large subunit ribosomal protein L6